MPQKIKKDFYDSTIDKYESMLETAVPQEDLDPASKKFSKSDSFQYSESIVGKFQKNGLEYVLMINNSTGGELSDVSMYMVGPGVYSIVNRASSGADDSMVKIPYDLALQQAEQLVTDMQSDLSLADSLIVVSESIDESGAGGNQYAYQFIFTREVNQFHVVFDTSCLSLAGTEEDNNASNEQPWPYESLVITVDDQGVQDVKWQGPCKVDTTLSDHVAMLPFSEIMNVFRQMIFIKNDEWETYIGHNEGWDRAVIQIDRITLGLMRVQSQGKYYLIPVWDFYGPGEYLMKDGTTLSKGDAEGQFRSSLNSLLTINAIDGSVIDRNLGY